jgi:hypothetical protein
MYKVEEKQEWQAQFGKLLSDRSEGAAGAARAAPSETTPMQAVKLLQSMRQEKLVLHRHMGELQSHLREVHGSSLVTRV